MSELVYIAIDAGGTYFKSALVTPEGEIQGVVYSVPSDSKGSAETILGAYRETIRIQAAALYENGYKFGGVCIDTPGPFDLKNGISLMEHKFAAIKGVDLKAHIRACLEAEGLDSGLPISFTHDSTAFLLGEAAPLERAGYRRIAGVMLGTGLGFAMAIDGRPLLSPTGGPAVSIWARPFKGKIAEDFISGRGVQALYGDSTKSALDIERLAKAGDEKAAEAYAEMGSLLGELLAPILTEYKIEAFIAGGQISRGFSLFGETLKAALAGVPTLKYIGAAENVDTCHLVGAALAAARGV